VKPAEESAVGEVIEAAGVDALGAVATGAAAPVSVEAVTELAASRDDDWLALVTVGWAVFQGPF
jgi:hypothetical protein